MLQVEIQKMTPMLGQKLTQKWDMEGFDVRKATK